MIEAANHELAVRLPAGPLPLNADPTRLAQILANLLNNAAKYTPSGGRIQLCAEVADAEILIRISDSGIGIPEQMLPRVFEMFSQVHRGMDQAHGGLGIGLTLVRRLVEMHGGSVDAHSAGSGQGSTFTVRLPMAPPGDLAAPAAPASTAQRPQRVLVVDDNIDAAETVSMLLSFEGHTTRVAHDGEAALAAAADFNPDIVLLDIGMPGKDGYETARELRQAHGAALRLIAVTGWGAEEDRRRAQAAGFDRHLVKPVDPAMLATVLNI